MSQISEYRVTGKTCEELVIDDRKYTFNQTVHFHTFDDTVAYSLIYFLLKVSVPLNLFPGWNKL